MAIVEHPDVRRMLLTSQAYVEAMRALLLETAKFIDLAHTRRRGGRAVPGLCRAADAGVQGLGSDWGFRVTEWCLQVYGGYGYIQDYPAEQYMRDAKIASIYEGTNGIQALDLVGRKLDGQWRSDLQGAAGQGREHGAAPADRSRAGWAGLQLAAALEEVSEVATEVPQRPDGP